MCDGDAEYAWWRMEYDRLLRDERGNRGERDDHPRIQCLQAARPDLLPYPRMYAIWANFRRIRREITETELGGLCVFVDVRGRAREWWSRREGMEQRLASLA